jgi:hypothetical protein
MDEAPKGGAKNLRPNQKKVDQLDKLAGEVWGVTPEAPEESLRHGSVLRIARKVSALSGDELAELAKRISRDPAEAQERLSRLAAMAGADPEGRSAAAIDTAAQAVEAAGVPRPRSADAQPSIEDAAITRSLLIESMPDGDWGALAKAFGSLDPEQRAVVLSRLSASGATTPTHRFYPAGADNPSTADASTTRGFVSRMLDGSSPEPTISPNQMALMLSPVNDADDLLMQIDNAKRTGNAELQGQLSAQLRESMQSGAFTREQMDEAVKRFTLRRQVEQEFRNQIIGVNPDYDGAQVRMLRASMPPAQPTAIPPGARSPEISPVDEVPAPQGADAQAALDERAAQVAANATGGGLTRAQRIEMLGLDPNNPQAMRKADLAFKGRDGRGTPFESRSAGDRAGELGTLDEQAIEQAEELKAAIDMAQAELRLAQMGRTPNPEADVAAAQQTLRNLYAREDKLFPPRLINERTGEVRLAPASMLANPRKVPPGFVIERGRRANTDSWLNRPGQQETFDRIIRTGAGMQPRGADNISRASDDMSKFDRAMMREEAIEMFGEEAAALMEDIDPDWAVDTSDLSDPSAPIKPGRLGGAQQQSLARAAVLSMYKGRNPLSLTNPRTKKRFTVEDVVDDLFTKSTDFNNPDSANTQMAKERWKALVEREFGTSGKPVVTRIEEDGRVVTEEVPFTNATPAPASSPAGGIGTAQDPASIPREGARDMRGLGRGVPNQRGSVQQLAPEQRLAEYEQKLEAFQRMVGRRGYAATANSDVLTPRTRPEGAGSPISSPEEQGFPVPIDSSGVPVAVKPAMPSGARDFSAPETVRSPEEQALLNSNIPLDDPEVIDAPDDPTAKPAAAGDTAEVADAPDDKPRSRGRRRTSKEENDELVQFEQDVRDEYRDSGLSDDEIEQEVRQRVNRRRAELEAETSAAVDAADDADVVDAPDDAPSKPASPEPSRPTGADGEDIVDMPSDTPAKPKGDGSGSEPPDGPKPRGEGSDGPAPTPKKRRLPWKRAALVGAGTLAYLYRNAGQPVLDGQINVPGEGGPGGGGSGGGGGTPYIPVGAGGASGVGAGPSSPEDAIERALERLRGSRKPSGMPAYNTMFNYTYRS